MNTTIPNDKQTVKAIEYLPVSAYRFHLEPVTTGVWFLSKHKSTPLSASSLTQSISYLLRDLLAAETTKPHFDSHTDWYDQHIIPADEVSSHILHEIAYDRLTGKARVTIGVTRDVTLEGEAVKELIKVLQNVEGKLALLTSRERPINSAIHLSEVAKRIESLYSEGDTAEESAAYLFRVYLCIFAAREYEAPFTPLEHLDENICNENDYRELERVGVIGEMKDPETDERSGWWLQMFAGEDD